MKAELSLEQFKRAISAVKHGCETDAFRPILKYIHISEKDGKLAFFSCNGFCAYRYIADVEVPKDFEAFILPFQVKANKRNALLSVVISTGENVSTVSIPTDYGSLSYSFSRPEGYPLDEDKLMSPAEGLVQQYYKPWLMAKACSAYEGFNCVSIAHCSAEHLQPAYLFANEDRAKLEVIVLPVRKFNE